MVSQSCLESRQEPVWIKLFESSLLPGTPEKMSFTTFGVNSLYKRENSRFMLGGWSPNGVTVALGQHNEWPSRSSWLSIPF